MLKRATAAVKAKSRLEIHYRTAKLERELTVKERRLAKLGRRIGLEHCDGNSKKGH